MLLSSLLLEHPIRSMDESGAVDSDDSFDGVAMFLQLKAMKTQAASEHDQKRYEFMYEKILLVRGPRM